MTSTETTTNTAAKRVLLLGRSADTLGVVGRELEALGLVVTGTTEPGDASRRYDAGDFDLIVIGGGVPGRVSDELKAAFAAQRPDVRLLETVAPVAVEEIVASLAGRSPSAAVDLDAYFARIGYDGPRTPTLETLHALVALHPAAIPFEAVDVLLDRGVDLSPAAVDAKLLTRRRGGYCFEHNMLLKRVLVALGFRVESLIGRVRWMAPPGAPARPRSHMALRVQIDDEPWLVDVAFGGCVLTAPVRFATTEPQPTPHEDFRVLSFGAGHLLQARLGHHWATLYELSTEAQVDADYVSANWFTSTSPASPFRQYLIVAKTTAHARYTLAQNRFTIRTADGQADRRRLDAEALERVLRETFGLPVEADWQPIIEKAAAGGPSPFDGQRE